VVVAWPIWTTTSRFEQLARSPLASPAHQGLPGFFLRARNFDV